MPRPMIARLVPWSREETRAGNGTNANVSVLEGTRAWAGDRDRRDRRTEGSTWGGEFTSSVRRHWRP
ncbi:hypothetical protein NHX12_028325 [Muraenolepis orangiensis]|uniref:Uncharacterized protein n=1 Tax=Muraenolepis orangiensis TaxID=630683 RepID=A0A9Q0IMF1_9TELE|nr:hypothetical protein NHX12_028325 [Muraenolepis orangiensis]